jgi:serine/threonine-protein kinase HipA
VLVCNGDAHLKNFTLLERPEGLRLSPVYDVLNVAVYANDGVSQQFALAIAGQKLNLEELTKPLLTEFALRVGLSKAAVDGTFRTLKTKARQARKLLPAPDDEGRDPFGARYSETVRNACLRLLEE